MKNISLVLNIVLLIAVGVLFYLHFAGKSPAATGSNAEVSNVQIAYIQSDSVLAKYDYLVATREKLDAKIKKFDMDLQGRAQSLQNEIESYQRNASTLTMGQARAVEEDLGKKRQNLQMYQEQLGQQMAIEQEKVTKDLYDRVTKFLSVYAKEKGIQVVLKYSNQSDVLYGTQALDISSDVIKGLNEQYKVELATPKADTTAAKKK